MFKLIYSDVIIILLPKWRCVVIKEQQINEQIRDAKVRLIDVDGTQLGIVSSKEAQNLAASKNFDLVKIAPNSNPPVCKIMDYGKYKYEIAKKEKESKKKQKVINVKEIRLRPVIEIHDLETKAKRAIKFLQNGDKLKVSVRFRGREMGHKNMGYEVIDKFMELLGEIAAPVEKKPHFEGNSMIIIVEANKTK